MCLIIFAYKSHAKYKLILTANRDEFFERPTQPADFWLDKPIVLGGRDIISGGTWLGITKHGRFTAITNYRNPDLKVADAVSRGVLSEQFLTGSADSGSFLAEVSKEKTRYQGFNILVSDDSFSTLQHYSNISDEVTNLSEGIYGLSNALLDTTWPKVNHGKYMLSTVIQPKDFDIEDLISMMSHTAEWPENALPQTGISLELEKKLSPVFISLKGYGTRCTTAMRMDYDQNLEFLEVSYDESGNRVASKWYTMTLKTP